VLPAQVWPSVVQAREGYIPAGPILVPITLALALVGCGCCVVSCAACMKARDGQFTDMYTRSWWRTQMNPTAAAATMPVGLPNPLHDRV